MRQRVAFRSGTPTDRATLVRLARRLAMNAGAFETLGELEGFTPFAEAPPLMLEAAETLLALAEREIEKGDHR